jgi:competence protein ComEA
VPELSRSQILVYGAVGVALLLLGARWIRTADERAPASSGGVSFAADSSSGASSASSSGGRDVVVHVAGAVRKPGVYTLPAGSRVDDAVERAGGITSDGSPDAINLAARLNDGQQVVVPSTKNGAATATATAPDAPISLGSATVEQLDTVEGIGPVTAQKIVDYRDQHGGFSSVDELDQVPGIGPATMEALKTRLQP